VTKLFRGCRYEVYVHTPNKGLWSRHSSFGEAQRSFRAAVNNQRGDHAVGTRVELADVYGGVAQALDSKVGRA